VILLVGSIAKQKSKRVMRSFPLKVLVEIGNHFVQEEMPN
jgi:hypothetical protein